MLKRTRRGARVLLAVALAGCAGESTLPQAANPLDGYWAEQIGIPGASTAFTLTVHDTTVTGSGTYAVEAGRNGTVQVSGVVSGGRVRLDIVRSDSLVTHFFQGVLETPALLSGQAYTTSPHQVAVSDPAPKRYTRVVLD